MTGGQFFLPTKASSFTSPSKGKIPMAEMITELESFMSDQEDYSYQLVIGTDSKSGKPDGKKPIDFVTAVVIHRKGKGGRYFWQKNRVEKISSLRDKIYTETLISIQLAEQLVPELTKSLNGDRYKLEIHIDVGCIGPTREMIKEVVGMVNGNGFTAKTKPEAYGASVIADKHT